MEHRQKYDEAVREFCISMHYISPNSLSFLRKTFENHLPSNETVVSWYSQSNVNVVPGIHKECIDILKKLASQRTTEKKLVCALMFDEMAIRRHIQFYNKTKKLIGQTKGHKELEQNTKIAKESLVFMASGVNEKFEIPLAYYFVNSMKAPLKNTILSEIIKEAANSNISISSITFDGLRSNFKMCEEFGANLNIYSKFFDPSLKVDDQKVSIFLDSCYALKNVRNTLGSKGIYLFFLLKSTK